MGPANVAGVCVRVCAHQVSVMSLYVQKKTFMFMVQQRGKHEDATCDE